MISIEYLAGFMDGEGWIGLIKHHQKNCYHVEVSVCNTNKQIIEMIHESFGGKYSKYIYKKRLQNKTIYKVTWWGYGAQEFLKQIKDKLIIKWAQAELCILFPIGEQGYRVLPMVKNLQIQLYKELQKLNKVGN